MLNFNRFEILTFDCYGTLIDWESGMIEALQGLAVRARRPLTRDEMAAIVDLMLASVRDVIAGQGMQLNVSAVAKALLAEQGYDAQFGARPLRRAIQRLIENPLSSELLRGTFVVGDTVRVDVENGAMTFTKE